MEKDKRTIKIVFIVIACVSVLCAGLLAWRMNPQAQMKRCLRSGQYEEAVTVYNSQIIGTKHEQKFRKELETCIEDTENNWEQETLDYKEAVSILEAIQTVDDEELAQQAAERAQYIEIEGENEKRYSLAKAHYEADQYPEALELLGEVEETYSKYADAKELYTRCIASILIEVKEQTSESEYDEDIKLLTRCLDKVDEPKLQERKTELEAELVSFREVSFIVAEAEQYYLEGEYGKAFDALAEGLEEYPDHEQLSKTLASYEERYAASVKKEVEAACEEKEYDKALSLVEEALENHDCEALRDLQEYVKQEKNLLNRIKKYFKDVFKGWF